MRKPKVAIGEMLEHEGYELHCLVQCGKCCDGDYEVPIYPKEARRLKTVPDYKVKLKRGIEHPEGKTFRILAHKVDGTCWYVQDGKCSIYDKRPECCRAWVCDQRHAEAIRLIRKKEQEEEKAKVKVKKEDLYVNVIFAELWTLGYLHRGGDRWSQFKKELTQKLKDGLKDETPCKLRIAVFSGASDIDYRVDATGAFGAIPPKGSNSREVRRAAEEIVGEHMRSYTFKYEKEKK